MKPTIINLILAVFVLGCSKDSSGGDSSGDEYVVTIYFGGSYVKETWWDADASGNSFDAPQAVAKLHREQDVSAGNQHKIWIDGVDTWFGRACGGLTGENWSDTHCTAKNLLETFLDNPNLEDGQVILNIIGNSRGGTSSIWFHKIALGALKCDDESDSYIPGWKAARIKHINIMVIDPVAGPFDTNEECIPVEVFDLDPRVKNYVGLYPRHERTAWFRSFIPRYSSSTNFEIFSIPGSHQTGVGLPEHDGHHLQLTAVLATGYGNANFIESLFMFPADDPYTPDSQIVKHSWITQVMAVELLKSDEWGNVQFLSSYLANSPSGGATLGEYDADRFKEVYNATITYSDSEPDHPIGDDDGYAHMMAVGFPMVDWSLVRPRLEYWDDNLQSCVIIDRYGHPGYAARDFLNPRCIYEFDGMENEAISYDSKFTSNFKSPEDFCTAFVRMTDLNWNCH